MTPVNILLDTNALWIPKEHRECLTRACQSGKIRAYLPALALVERVRQLLQKGHELLAQGRTSDPERGVRWFREWVQEWARELTTGEQVYQPILAFDQEQARQVGISWQKWLAGHRSSYVTDRLSDDVAVQAWRERYKDKHPVMADLDWLIHKADWSIAAVARYTGWPIVTDDTDPPFQQPGVTTLTLSEFVTHYLTEVD
jgi:predicted nucleic acid-binding protein